MWSYSEFVRREHGGCVAGPWLGARRAKSLDRFKEAEGARTLAGVSVTDSSPPQEKPSLEAGCAVACYNSNLVLPTLTCDLRPFRPREGDRANAIRDLGRFGARIESGRLPASSAMEH